MNTENLVTPRQFAERLKNEENVQVCAETIRNAIRNNYITPEMTINNTFLINFEKNKTYRPMKVGRPAHVY